MSGGGLICSGLRMGFGRGSARVEVLRGVEFSAAPGRITFILGPSGSGKSTLLCILAGILTPDAGQVRVCDTRLLVLSRGARRRHCARHIGIAPQRDHLIPSLTARENAALGLIAQGAPRRQALTRADEQLAALGLEGKGGMRPRALSVGQRQRVAIARALAPSPSVLLCDEPTAALDEAASAQAMRLLRDGAAQAGRAVVMVTHDETLPGEEDALYRLGQGVLSRCDNRSGKRRGAEKGEAA